MLTRLKIQGFKNLVDVEVRFGPLNVIDGPNGVGKSNLFDAVRFLSLLADHPFVTAASRVRGGEEPEALVLLFCNGATVLASQIDEGVAALRSDPEIDSVTTASCYNMWSPLRARKMTEGGRLVPFIEPEYFGDQVTCDRGSQGDAWYADCSMFVVRPHCMDSRNGAPPFQWLGRSVHAIKQWGGLDIDYHWQVPIVEYWLREHGFTDESTPY